MNPKEKYIRPVSIPQSKDFLQVPWKTVKDGVEIKVLTLPIEYLKNAIYAKTRANSSSAATATLAWPPLVKCPSVSCQTERKESHSRQSEQLL